MRKWLGMLAVGLCLTPAVASAGGATAPGATSVRVGGGWIQDTLQQTPLWYRFTAVPGRSYCVETQAGDDNSDFGDTSVVIYKADGSTLLAVGIDDIDPATSAPVEVSGFQFSRACVTAGVGDVLLRFTLQNVVGAGTKVRRLRVVETTMWCPWFVSNADYTAFVLIKNTTINPFAITVTAHDTTGAVLASTTGTIPAQGSLNFVLAQPPFNLTNNVGTLTIVRAAAQPAGTPDAAGGPGALIANATTISLGAGVSFDTPFAPRADWQQ
jgi:hypothetical protein